MWHEKYTLSKKLVNPFYLDPGRGEKIKALKAFIKPFEAPQRSAKKNLS